MSRLSRGPTPLRTFFRQIHPVDRSLLIFMAVLLAQSVYNLFVPGDPGQATGDIDIVVRTSSAAIFGYFLSANFTRRTTSSRQAPVQGQAHMLEMGERTAPTGPMARIGFDAGSDPALPGPPPAQATSPAGETASTGCLQIRVAAAIGLLCLVALLALRNLSQWGMLSIQWEAVTATVSQLRDFISGCVGFLIGCPTQSDPSVPSSNQNP